MNSKLCPYQSACRYLKKTLRKASIDPNSIAPCPVEVSSLPCTVFISHVRILHEVLPSAVAIRCLKLVKALFGDEPFLHTSTTELSKIPKFFCPELNIVMSQPCLLSSCPFHTPNEFVQNCILRYLNLQEKESLSGNELIFLLNSPAPLVRAKISSALKRARRAVLKKLIEKEQEGLFTRVWVSTTCPVCEKSTKTSSVVKKGFIYCGPFCAALKPPKVLYLEQEFSYPLEKLLALCKAQFSDQNLIKSTLGLSSKFLASRLASSK